MHVNVFAHVDGSTKPDVRVRNGVAIIAIGDLTITSRVGDLPSFLFEMVRAVSDVPVSEIGADVKLALEDAITKAAETVRVF